LLKQAELFLAQRFTLLPDGLVVLRYEGQDDIVKVPVGMRDGKTEHTTAIGIFDLKDAADFMYVRSSFSANHAGLYRQWRSTREPKPDFPHIVAVIVISQLPKTLELRLFQKEVEIK